MESINATTVAEQSPESSEMYEAMARAPIVAMNAVAEVLGPELAPYAAYLFRHAQRGDIDERGDDWACGMGTLYVTIARELAFITQIVHKDREELRKRLPLVIGDF